MFAGVALDLLSKLLDAAVIRGLACIFLLRLSEVCKYVDSISSLRPIRR